MLELQTKYITADDFKNYFGKTTPCTENAISAVSEFDFSDQWINYLMMNRS